MIQRFEQFTSAIFEISRYWHKLAEEDLSEEARETFCQALFSITGHLREISKRGLPQP